MTAGAPLDVAIVGGGVGGLATAALLAADGHRVTLFEATDAVGGRAGSWEKDGFRFDTGPSWYLMPEVFDHFFRLLGTSADEQLSLTKLDPGYRAYFEGDDAPFDLPAGRERARAAFASLDPASAPAINRYLDSATEAYRIAVDRFLYSSFESARPYLDGELARAFPRFASLLTRTLDRHVAKHTRDARLRRLFGYAAVFLGGSPMKVPALYHLMSHLDVEEGVLYPAGGFHEVVRVMADLARAKGADIRVASPVERIVVENRAARGVEFRSADGELHRHDADLVVAAADLHHVESQLLGDGERDHDERYWQNLDMGPGAIIAMLGVRGEITELAHHTLLLADDWDGAFEAIEGDVLPETPSLYIGRPSASDPTVAPAGHENLFVLIPSPARAAMAQGGVDGAGDAEIERYVDHAIDQISRWAGIPDLAERVVVRRTFTSGDLTNSFSILRGSMLGPSHVLKQSAFWRAGNRSKRVRNLLFAGSSTIPGIGVPMCLISAELVLKRTRGDRTAGPIEVS